MKRWLRRAREPTQSPPAAGKDVAARRALVVRVLGLHRSAARVARWAPRIVTRPAFHPAALRALDRHHDDILTRAPDVGYGTASAPAAEAIRDRLDRFDVANDGVFVAGRSIDDDLAPPEPET